MKLYDELAPWWPLLSRPLDYREEAGFYADLLIEAARRPVETVLELGSGGGNNASHMKTRFRLTLSDISSEMIDVSRRLNPECEHVVGDMRTLRLGRTFDAVFVHDAICYLTTPDDVRATVRTAFEHCAPGGSAVFAPDDLKETFRERTHQGGHDGPDRSIRYLEWAWDPDPEDDTFVVDYACILRERDGSVRVEHDRHTNGLFSREAWIGFIADAGFEPAEIRFEHTEVADPIHVFTGTRPA
jgi:trans-aconitate methyltransferase